MPLGCNPSRLYAETPCACTPVENHCSVSTEREYLQREGLCVISVSQILRHLVQGSKITGFQVPGSRPVVSRSPNPGPGSELPRAPPRVPPSFERLKLRRAPGAWWGAVGKGRQAGPDPRIPGSRILKSPDDFLAFSIIWPKIAKSERPKSCSGRLAGVALAGGRV